MMTAVVTVLLVVVIILIICVVCLVNEFREAESRIWKRLLRAENEGGFSLENKKRINRIWKRLRELEDKEDNPVFSKDESKDEDWIRATKGELVEALRKTTRWTDEYRATGGFSDDRSPYYDVKFAQEILSRCEGA